MGICRAAVRPETHGRLTGLCALCVTGEERCEPVDGSVLDT